MAGHMTGLAYAGITDAWKEKAMQTSIDNDLSEYLDTKRQEQGRRQRIMDRIRAEEKAQGIIHPEHREERYDRWVMTNEFV